MGHRVDNRFGHHLLGNLVGARRLNTLGPRADGSIDFAQYEVDRLVDQLEYGSLIDLVRRDRLLYLCPVEMSALDLRREQKALRSFPKQQDGGVGQPSLVQQPEVLQQHYRRCLLRQRKLPDPARPANEAGHPRGIEITDHGVLTRRRVERSEPNQILDLEVLHERRVEAGNQLLRGIELLANQPGLGTTNQRLHLPTPRAVVSSFHKDQTMLAEGRRMTVLSFGWRHAFLIFGAVLGPKQPYVDVGVLDLMQIELIRPAVGRGSVLEQKDLEEAPHQPIPPQVISERATLAGEFSLHAADEDANGSHRAFIVAQPGPSPLPTSRRGGSDAAGTRF